MSFLILQQVYVDLSRIDSFHIGDVIPELVVDDSQVLFQTPVPISPLRHFLFSVSWSKHRRFWNEFVEPVAAFAASAAAVAAVATIRMSSAISV